MVDRCSVTSIASSLPVFFGRKLTPAFSTCHGTNGAADCRNSAKVSPSPIDGQVSISATSCSDQTARPCEAAVIAARQTLDCEGWEAEVPFRQLCNGPLVDARPLDHRSAGFCGYRIGQRDGRDLSLLRLAVLLRGAGAARLRHCPVAVLWTGLAFVWAHSDNAPQCEHQSAQLRSVELPSP